MDTSKHDLKTILNYPNPVKISITYRTKNPSNQSLHIPIRYMERPLLILLLILKFV